MSVLRRNHGLNGKDNSLLQDQHGKDNSPLHGVVPAGMTISEEAKEAMIKKASKLTLKETH
jgi:hypothetical protein